MVLRAALKNRRKDRVSKWLKHFMSHTHRPNEKATLSAAKL